MQKPIYSRFLNKNSIFSSVDEILYYKYKVTCDGKTVGDFYFSKEPTYKFTPESGKKYQVTVYVQAHDEESTTVTETCRVCFGSGRI